MTANITSVLSGGHWLFVMRGTAAFVVVRLSPDIPAVEMLTFLGEGNRRLHVPVSRIEAIQGDDE